MDGNLRTSGAVRDNRGSDEQSRHAVREVSRTKLRGESKSTAIRARDENSAWQLGFVEHHDNSLTTVSLSSSGADGGVFTHFASSRDDAEAGGGNALGLRVGRGARVQNGGEPS